MGRDCRSLPPVQVPHHGARTAAPRGPDDPLETDRATRLGAFLRRARFDELPQIVNVFRGEMSLIGPRPDDLPHAMSFMADIPGYRRRYAVRPGISGLAQVELGYVHGRDGASRKTALDLHYIRHAGPASTRGSSGARSVHRGRPQGDSDRPQTRLGPSAARRGL
jgi:hypothetical protein